MRPLITRITINSSTIWLTIDKQAIHVLQKELSELAFRTSEQEHDSQETITNPFEIVYPAERKEDATTIACKIAIEIKRHDGRRYIVSPDGKPFFSVQNTSYQSDTILMAIAEVYAWKDFLYSHQCSIKELAKDIGKSEHYIYNRIKLLYLSLTILKAITTHTLSPLISLKDLLKAANCLDWKQQHQYLSLD